MLITLNLGSSGARRRAIASTFIALAVSTCLLHTLVANAAAPQVGAQSPGFYRIMVGSIEVTALNDGTLAFPINEVMTGLERAEVARDLANEELHVPFQESINAYLVNTGNKLVLIDTGAGALYGDCCGRVIANMRAAGYTPEQIDEIVITHPHADHVGGVLVDGKMAFPNAVIRVSKRDADYWLNAENKASAPKLLSPEFDGAEKSLAPYIAAGRLKTFDGNAEIEPGIRAQPAYGHTPGHTAYFVGNGGETLVVWGDVAHVAAVQLRNPKAAVEWDSDLAVARRTRSDYFMSAARHHYMIAAAHISFLGIGHLRKDGNGYDWIPVNYDAAPTRNRVAAKITQTANSSPPRRTRKMWS